MSADANANVLEYHVDRASIFILSLSSRNHRLPPTADARPGSFVVRHLLVLGDKLLDSLDVLLLGVGGAQILVFLPLVVLGLALRESKVSEPPLGHLFLELQNVP